VILFLFLVRFCSSSISARSLNLGVSTTLFICPLMLLRLRVFRHFILSCWAVHSNSTVMSPSSFFSVLQFASLYSFHCNSTFLICFCSLTVTANSTFLSTLVFLRFQGPVPSLRLIVFFVFFHILFQILPISSVDFRPAARSPFPFPPCGFCCSFTPSFNSMISADALCSD
jgi:hypothetical protein